MSENPKNDKTKINMPVLLDGITGQLNACVASIMQSRGVPPEIMIYAVKEVLLDLYEAKINRMANVIVEMGSESEKHGD